MAFLGQLATNGRRWLALASLGLLGTAASAALTTTAARAADELILTYGPIQQTINIDNLTAFAETGEQSSEIRYLLRVSGQDPESVRSVLNYELNVDFLVLHRVLNSLPGEYLLYELGKILHTKSRRANIQALRSAVLLPMSEDNQLTALELFQNYPTQQMYLDGVELVQVARRFGGLVANLRNDLAGPIAIIEDFLSGLACDCEPTETAAP